MLTVLGVSAVLIPLIQGVFLDSHKEYRAAHQRLSELQARYNAKSGLNLGILRVCVFKGLVSALPEQWMPFARPFMDRIWSFPSARPLPVPEDLFESDKQTIKELKNKSFFKGSYVTVVEVEDGLLGINNLVSPLASQNSFTRIAFTNLLGQLLEEADLKESLDIDSLPDSLSLWMDQNASDPLGGAEGKKPLKRSLISVEEIKKAPALTSEIFKLLKPYITVYGAPGLNINYAPKAVLEKALGFPVEVADHILARTRQSSDFYKPFENEENFCQFIENLGISFCASLKENFESLDVLEFAPPISFRIQSVGRYKGGVSRLEALLADLSARALSYQKALYSQSQRAKGGQEGENKAPDKKSDSKKAGDKKLKFNYSYAKSLIIMYLKEET